VAWPVLARKLAVRMPYSRVCLGTCTGPRSRGIHAARVFRIDPETGDLGPTGQDLSVGNPVCVLFVSARDSSPFQLHGHG